jgi:hypothetical protein
LTQGPGRIEKIFDDAILISANGDSTNHVPLGGPFIIQIDLNSQTTHTDPIIGLGIDDTFGHRVLSIHTPVGQTEIDRVEGKTRVVCMIEDFPLAPGDYWIKLAFTVRNQTIDSVERALFFTVVNGVAFGDGRGFHAGLCIARSKWTLIDGTSSTKSQNKLVGV